MPEEPLWDTNDYAAFVKRKRNTCEKDRLEGNGPPFIKVGRLVRYRPEDVRKWLFAQTRKSTSDDGAEKKVVTA